MGLTHHIFENQYHKKQFPRKTCPFRDGEVFIGQVIYIALQVENSIKPYRVKKSYNPPGQIMELDIWQRSTGEKRYWKRQSTTGTTLNESELY